MRDLALYVVVALVLCAGPLTLTWLIALFVWLCS